MGPRRKLGLAGLAGLALACASACLLDLEHEVACGDGHTDVLSGEECDPGDPASFEDACTAKGFTAGLARCDPATCQIVADAESCAVCGDAVISPGEQCDGDSLGNQRCPSGENRVTCDLDMCRLSFDACPSCGNGELEPELGEECDWNYHPGEGDVSACSDLEPIGAIQHKGYVQGQVTHSNCTDTCQFSRNSCSFCGDGILDDSYLDHGPQGKPALQGAEQCDGAAIDSDFLSDSCKQICGMSNLELRCDFECVDKCGAITIPSDAEEARCCVPGGASCDLDIPCCFKLDHPEEVGDGDGCGAVVVETENGPPVYSLRCRSI